jgi:hypothetical protein
MRTLCRLFILLISIYSLHAQTAVVSEYFNVSATPIGEWTEIVVLQDGASLVGFVLRDNGGSGTTYEWQGGIKFKSVPEFQNLKRGTIIVVNHRNDGSPIDANPSDGYMEIPATNSSYFDKVDYPTTESRPWEDKALSIGQDGDIYQLLNSSGSNEHTLAHKADYDGSDYRKITGSKANIQSAISSTQSVFVDAAVTGDYSNSSKARIGSGGTKGLPNSSANSGLWRILREPAWTNPNLKAELGVKKINLTWTPSPDVFGSDAGYLVLRYPSEAAGGALPPVDGIQYAVGDKLGSATVIANSPDASYVDNTDLPCSQEYTYRVYAYRFNSTGSALESNPANARGRAYNETTFAQAVANKKGPAKPALSAQSNIVKFCEGGSVKLDLKSEAGAYEFRWFRNNDIIPNESSNTLIAKEGGEYVGAIFDPATQCLVLSNAITLTKSSFPDAKISLKGKLIGSDTTIYLCVGRNVILTSNTATNAAWYKNGVKVVVDKDKFTAFENGKYFLTLTNDNLCVDTSVVVEVKIIDPKFSVSPTELSFALNSTESYKDKTINVTNNGDLDFVFSEIISSGNYVIVSPQAPYLVPAKQAVPFTIRFIPKSSGTYNETIKFKNQCSDIPFELTVKGEKEQSLLSSSEVNVDFSNVLLCELNKAQKEITLTNTGSDPVTINKPTISDPFEITGNFPAILNQNGVFKFTVKLNTSATVGLYQQDLNLPYSVGSGSNNLKIALGANIILPKYELNQDVNIDGYNDATVSQNFILEIHNSGLADIKIENQLSDPNVQIMNLPIDVQVGETSEIIFQVKYSGTEAQPYNIKLPISPCDQTQAIAFHCWRSGINISNTNIDFSTIYLCPGNPIVNKEQSFTISTIGNVSDPKITSIINSDHFSIDIKDGSTIVSPATIKVSFKADKPGEYSETIKFKVSPLAKEYEINLKANVKNLDLTIPDTLHYVITKTTEMSNRIISINNNNSIPVTIESVVPPTAPFELMANLTTPQTLIPGAKFEIPLEFKPVSEGLYIKNIILRIKTDECVFDTSIVLRAESKDDSKYHCQLYFTKNQTVEVGNIFSVPVSVKLYNLKYEESGIKNIQFDLKYNESVYLPVEILFDQSISARNISITKTGANTSQVSFDILESQAMIDGQLFHIRSKALWGNSIKDSIIMQNVKFTSSKNFYSGKDTTFLSLIGDCAFETGLISINGDLSLKANISSKSLSFDYSLATEDNSSLEIFDAYGSTVSFASLTAKPGKYSYELSKELSDGVYFAILKNGIQSVKLKLLICR